ncbi:hemolysin [Salinisphaera sp. PC39]|uniref:GNAT family N-acetyltransferase n=1 Tax=Salinisphaera sp. PC39 TaxID=1304156 RepID=UPI0033414F62
MATAARELSRRPAPRFTCRLAEGRREIEESLRLRHRVFVEEMGAEIDDPDSGLERDQYDRHCHHLLVRDNRDGRLVASTRILTQERAAFAGGFYSAGEFDLDAVLSAPGRFMEIGRTCVAREHRRGAVIAVLWSGVSGFIRHGGYSHLIGCASIELDEGMARAHAIHARLAASHGSPAEYRVAPRLALPGEPPAETGNPRLPPLLKAYISLGATVGGPPCWDPDFKVADLFMHLQVANLCPRYVRHFLQRSRPAVPRAVAAHP